MDNLHSVFVEVDAIIARGDPESALSILENVHHKFPQNEVVRIKIANLLAFLGKWEEAEAVLTKMLKEGCEGVWLYISLFDVFVHIGKIKQAATLLEPHAERFGNFWPFRERLSRARAYFLINKRGAPDRGCSVIRNSFLVIGSSHINAIRGASKYAEQEHLRNSYTFKSIIDFKNDSKIIDPVDGGFDDYQLNENMKKWLYENRSFDKIFLSISGSDYLSFCISAPNPSYDIIIPGREDLPRINGARVVPYEEMKARLKRHIRHVVLGIKAIRAEVSAPIIYLEPPPPIEDNQHLTQHAGWAERLLANSGPSSPIVRYKLWLLHSEIIKEACESVGVVFLELPSSVLNERGYLADSMLLNDVMHANLLFGAEILMQMDSFA
ncbi:tetratricopeptide repeat protein [Azospirillum himalayense]|uniref:Tetratricopeptide repeat protein n=1 Tax=Azospirillum himalayense TaxID=654847 RepID=A0ABW0G5I9_9PROT